MTSAEKPGQPPSRRAGMPRGDALPAGRRTRAARGDVAAAHARFARAALAIYLGAAAIGVALLVASITEERAYQEQQIRDRLLLDTQTRADYLAKHLRLLVGELMRLGLRSEINLLDQNTEPERSLLRLAHEKSTFFNVGVALVGADGRVMWSEPQSFIAPGTSFADQRWLEAIMSSRAVRVVPVDPDGADDALLYVVAPVIRNQQAAGALVGGIDLARGGTMETGASPSAFVLTVLATRNGGVVYPPKPPAFATEPAWKSLFERSSWEPFLSVARLSGSDVVVAATQAPDTDLILLSIADSVSLFGPARTRMLARLSLGLSLAIVPLALLVFLLARTLKVFRQAEEAALREERLSLLGEAASLIAHEVKNSLNGLRIGLEMLVHQERATRSPSEERVVNALRKQIQRMSEFTTELLIFSKGISPRPVEIDLVEFVHKVTESMRDTASELGVPLSVTASEARVPVRADPSLIHVVISNLLGNAIDAVSGNGLGRPPRVEVAVGRSGGAARVRVSDSGPGVAEAVRAQLFEPFVSGKPSGVGVGLALSRKIARAHGGDLTLEPTEEGATFLLTLPVEGP